MPNDLELEKLKLAMRQAQLALQDVISTCDSIITTQPLLELTSIGLLRSVQKEAKKVADEASRSLAQWEESNG